MGRCFRTRCDKGTDVLQNVAPLLPFGVGSFFTAYFLDNYQIIYMRISAAELHARKNTASVSPAALRR